MNWMKMRELKKRKSFNLKNKKKIREKWRKSKEEKVKEQWKKAFQAIKLFTFVHIEKKTEQEKRKNSKGKVEKNSWGNSSEEDLDPKKKWEQAKEEKKSNKVSLYSAENI